MHDLQPELTVVGRVGASSSRHSGASVDGSVLSCGATAIGSGGSHPENTVCCGASAGCNGSRGRSSSVSAVAQNGGGAEVGSTHRRSRSGSSALTLLGAADILSSSSSLPKSSTSLSSATFCSSSSSSTPSSTSKSSSSSSFLPSPSTASCKSGRQRFRVSQTSRLKGVRGLFPRTRLACFFFSLSVVAGLVCLGMFYEPDYPSLGRLHRTPGTDENLDIGVEFAGRAFKTAIKLEHIPGRFRGYDKLIAARKSAKLNGAVVAPIVAVESSEGPYNGERKGNNEDGNEEQGNKDQGAAPATEEGEEGQAGSEGEEEAEAKNKGEEQDGAFKEADADLEKDADSPAAAAMDASTGNAPADRQSSSDEGESEGKRSGEEHLLPAEAEAASFLLENAHNHRGRQ